MEKTWKYMNFSLNPEELLTKDELIEMIRDGGGTDAALADLREQQHEKYGNELIWRFPISEGESAGGFIMPVREGILWIPYDEMEKETGEILLLDDAELLTEDACEIMADLRHPARRRLLRGARGPREGLVRRCRPHTRIPGRFGDQGFLVVRARSS